MVVGRTFVAEEAVIGSRVHLDPVVLARAVEPLDFDKVEFAVEFDHPVDLLDDPLCVVTADGEGFADEDAAAYAEFMETRSEEARRRTIDVPEEIAANADEVERLAGQVGAQLTSRVAGDAEAAGELARAAARVARRLAELNA